MNTLIYLTDNIFLERDYERFHIKFLRKKFKIKILDLSKLINHELHELYKDSIFKKEDYLNFSNMNEFKIYMKEFQNSLIIDQLGVTVKTIEVRKFLLKIECKLIKVIVGTLPFPPKKKLLSRAFDHLVLRKNSGKSILKKIIDNLVIHDDLV